MSMQIIILLRMTAELDRSRPVKKGAATRRRLVEQVAVNMHTMGTSFV